MVGKAALCELPQNWSFFRNLAYGCLSWHKLAAFSSKNGSKTGFPYYRNIFTFILPEKRSFITPCPFLIFNTKFIT